MKVIRAINNVNVEPQYCTLHDKEIILVPIVHYGKETFYNNLKDSITIWKSKDYTICYEQVKANRSSMELDSASYDIMLMKWRKIRGGFTNWNKRAETLDEKFKDCIPQPKYKELGVDSLDVNVDVALIELVRELEMSFGEIRLDSCDYSTHLDSTYACGERFKVNFTPVIIDYRNEQVVEKLKNLDSAKLVLLFGAAHIPGIKRLLKETEAIDSTLAGAQRE